MLLPSAKCATKDNTWGVQDKIHAASALRECTKVRKPSHRALSVHAASLPLVLVSRLVQTVHLANTNPVRNNLRATSVKKVNTNPIRAKVRVPIAQVGNSSSPASRANVTSVLLVNLQLAVVHPSASALRAVKVTQQHHLHNLLAQYVQQASTPM